MAEQGVVSRRAKRLSKKGERVSKEEATQAEGVPLGKDAPAATSGVPAFQGVDELNEMDDWSSAWQDAKENGKAWGGRGKGGRGIQRNTFQPKDIYVEGVTLSYQGVDLLERTTIRLGHGRKYGLVGANGVGKTTLLRRIAAGAVPGWPLHLRSFLVQQEEMVGSDTSTALETVLAADTRLVALLQEAERLESMGEPNAEGAPGSGTEVHGSAGSASEEHVEGAVARLQEIYEEIDVQGLHGTEGRALSTLKGLGFSEARMAQPTAELSGGWMMRLALACALQSQPDLLLLDEPTNHLDLEGVVWLSNHLQESTDSTVIVVSHDAAFLDAVATDIMHFRQKNLHYYPGNYSAFQKAKADKDTHASRMEETLERQRKHIESSVKKMEKAAAGKGGDQKKLGQVASRKKKLGRHGMEKDINGHRFRAQHNVTKYGSGIRAGAVNENALGWKDGKMTRRSLAPHLDREIIFKFPEVDPLPGGRDAPLVQCRDVFFSFGGHHDTPIKGSSDDKDRLSTTKKTRPLLEGVCLSLTLSSRVVLVGQNGSGKSTLMRLIADAGAACSSPGDAVASGGEERLGPTAGEIIVQRNVRLGLFTQRHQEKLCMTQSPLQHMAKVFPGTIEVDLRKQLGSCGVSGSLALQPIKTLSGGQKSRVVLSELLMHRPHIMLLDEPTNHLDMASIEALRVALGSFAGGVVIVSHDQALISDMLGEGRGELWSVSRRQVTQREGGLEEYVAEVEERLRRKAG